MRFERIGMLRLIININNIYTKSSYILFPILGYTNYSIKKGIMEFHRRTAHTSFR